MRWSECSFCESEEESIRIDGTIVQIYECQECGREYCNKCGTIKEFFICNECLNNRNTSEEEIMSAYAQFPCKFNKEEKYIGCGACMMDEWKDSIV